MDPHPHPQPAARQRRLHLRGSRETVARALKDKEERIPLGPHLDTAVAPAAARTRSRCAISASAYRLAPSSRSNRVDPSTSVNSIVTVPVGRRRSADPIAAATLPEGRPNPLAQTHAIGAGRPPPGTTKVTISRLGAITFSPSTTSPTDARSVRRPGPRLPEGLVRHAIGSPVDVDLAERQWRSYVDAMRGEGWEIIEVAPADDCPDAVFVEDTVVVYGDLAVITRPGADERKPEVAGTEATLASLGYRIARIEPPGTLDGGDVLKCADVVWVGLSGRTNASGVQQLAELLGPLGARVVGVPSPGRCI